MPFRRSTAAALFAVALAAGCKDVTQEPAPTSFVVAAFNASVCSPSDLLHCPTTVPTPNDLALQAVPTLDTVHEPWLTGQKALLQAFIGAGGFPTDQAVELTIPLKRVSFDAATGQYVPQTYAQFLASGPVVKQATLTTTGASPNVVVMKIDGASPQVIDVEVDPANCTTGQIALLKKMDPLTQTRAWAPGRYAFAIRGGAAGVRTTSDEIVNADTAIALVWPDKDLSNPDNQPPGGLTPALVAQVEPVRKSLWNPVAWQGVAGYWSCNPANPLPTADCPAVSGAGAFPAISSVIPPDQVAVIGTFTVQTAVHTLPGAYAAVPKPSVPVDAASGLAPLPLDLLRTANHGTTIAYNPLFGAAAQGLTSLDGFSTTGTIVAPSSVPIDVSSVDGSTVRLYKLTAGPTLLPELKDQLLHGGNPATAAYVAQPDPLNIAQGITIGGPLACPLAGGCSVVVGLQAGVPVSAGGGSYFLPPLEEATDYAVVITTGVKDVFGRPLERSTAATILTDPSPGFDAIATSSVDGHSLLAGVDDASATALLKMRLQLKAVPEVAAGGGNVVMAYTFRTQTVTATSLLLSQAPYGTEQALAAAVFFPAYAATITPPAGTYGNVAAFYDVKFPSIDATDKTTGALNPDQAAWGTAILDAIVAVPYATNPNLAACPGGSPLMCAPLVVFGHGLHGAKENVYAVVDSLAAKGFVVAAIDFPQHGARSWCFASSQCDVGGVAGTGTCTPFPGGLGQGDVVGGVPTAPGTCTVGVPDPSISGQTFISANFFRTRDALRQNLIDQAALVLALARPPATGWPFQPSSADPFQASAAANYGIAVYPGSVYWEGISLGGIAGTEVLATDTRFSRGVTSVAGGTLVDFFTHSPGFQSSVLALFTTMLKPELDAIAPGTPFTFDLVDGTSPSFNLGVASAYLNTLIVAKWILDPGEPLNYARLLDGAITGGEMRVLGQVAVNDQVIPNPFNLELFANDGADFVEYASTVYPAANMHGILGFDPTVQADAAQYLFDLTVPTPATKSIP